MISDKIIVIDNPLAKHYLTILRDKNTPPSTFREYMRKIGFILGYEASRFLKWKNIFVDTPLARANGLKIGKPIYIVGVLGASIPLIQGIWDALPCAGLGLVAAKRIEYDYGVDVEVYYERLPTDLSDYICIIGDPMLATGLTISKTIDILIKRGCRDIVVLAVIASKHGLEYVHQRYPEIPIIVVEVDPLLNDKFFIVPGLGDAGDRGLGVNGLINV